LAAIAPCSQTSIAAVIFAGKITPNELTTIMRLFTADKGFSGDEVL
jgi:hypothetical protein